VAAGVARQLADEEPLGFAVGLVVVARLAAVAFGLAQFGPAAGTVHRALKAVRVHEGLHREHRMRVARLPVGAEAGQHPDQDDRPEVGHRPAGQQQEAHIIGHQGQPPPPLLGVPADPGLARPQMPRRRRKDQHRHPLSLRVVDRVVQLFAHRLHGPQVVVRGQQRLRTGAQLRRVQQLHLQSLE